MIDQSRRGSDRLLSADIIREQAPFLLLMRDRKFEEILDRLQVLSDLAQSALG